MGGQASSGIGLSLMEHHVQADWYDLMTACRHITSLTVEMRLEAYRSDIRTQAACELNGHERLIGLIRFGTND
jgi:hypothetical protein